MKVVVYPADRHGCGHHRLIWPSEELQRAGHDVTIVRPEDRFLTLVLDRENDHVLKVELDPAVDVVVLQRVTHRYLAQAVGVLRSQGVAVVVDVDDDLSVVHPANPAWRELHPNREQLVFQARPHMHSWHYLAQACRDATLVTVTTGALLRRYARHGRGHELSNYLAEHYYGVEHVDSSVLGWPASLHSHPDDPSAVGNALARLAREGVQLRVAGSPDGVAAAFGVDDDAVTGIDRAVALRDWPGAVAELGVGIAPLADTKFNAAKSWLKPLELAAVGVPWVASARVEYRRLHALGCGVIVDKPKEWYRAVRGLLDDPTRRSELSDAGRVVAEELRLRRHAWRWWEAWERALVVQRDADRSVVVVP